MSDQDTTWGRCTNPTAPSGGSERTLDLRELLGGQTVTRVTESGESAKFRVGDRVKKVKGYAFFGVVLAVYRTEVTTGPWRYVVRSLAPHALGLQHIYSGEQLAPYEDALWPWEK